MQKVKIDKQFLENNVTIDESSSCWMWKHYCNPDGYGQRKNNGKTRRMHRVSYELYNGPIPEGLCVLHRCDIPSCCNPEHLYLGTHSDNMRDMWDKNRHHKPTHTPNAKLAQEDVRYIKQNKGKLLGQELAYKFGMSVRTIYAIWQGRIWNEI